MHSFDLKIMSIEQLKALGYDVISQLEQAQANLQSINAEIQSRHQAEAPEPPALAEEGQDGKA